MKKQASNTPKQEAAGAGDNSNSAIGITVKTKFEPTVSQRVIGSDTFSYYSNKLNLTRALHFEEHDEQVIQSTSIMTSQGPVAKRRKGSSAHPVLVQDGGIRQTRISFEAHPSLLIYDDIISMIERMYCDCADISDDEEEESSEEVSDDAASKDEKKRREHPAAS